MREQGLFTSKTELSKSRASFQAMAARKGYISTQNVIKVYDGDDSLKVPFWSVTQTGISLLRLTDSDS